MHPVAALGDTGATKSAFPADSVLGKSMKYVLADGSR